MAKKKKVESIVKDIKRKTRRKFSAEEKITIVPIRSKIKKKGFYELN